MLKQLAKHRWICFVQGGLTLLFGVCLLYLRSLMLGQFASTLISVFALLAGGCLLIAAGMLDLAVAVGITAHLRSVRSALLWWMAGMLGVSTGMVLLFAPQFSVELLAYFAAAHAGLAGAIDLLMHRGLRRHPLYRNLMLGSALTFLGFAIGLLLSAFSGSEVLAMQVVGIYATYFGLRMVWLGSRLPRLSHTSSLRSQPVEVHAHP
jgi:uncharacterized membrane protein HdeD (DUF308 family)